MVETCKGCESYYIMLKCFFFNVTEHLIQFDMNIIKSY